MYNEIETIDQFDYSIQKQFNDHLYGYPSRADWDYFLNPMQCDRPEFDLDNIEHDLNIGLENWSICAGYRQVQIIKSTKAANKRAQLFQLYLLTIYGHDQRAAIKYWKSLTDDQKAALDRVLDDHLVYLYNYQIEDLNWIESQKGDQ